MASTSATLSKRSRVLQRRETMVSYLFLAARLVLLCGLCDLPMFMGFVTSFTNSSLSNSNAQFVWFDNYIRLFQDKIFWKSALNTVIIVVVSVPPGHCLLPVGWARPSTV